jgi:hypothetical protein
MPARKPRSPGLFPLAGLVFAFAANCSASGSTQASSSSGGASSSGGTTASSSSGTTSSSSGGCGDCTGLTISPNSQAFGGLDIGSACAAPRTFSVTNTGTAESGTVTLGVTGSNAGDFSLGANTCTGPLAVGKSCTVSVAFSPSSAGSEAAILTATANTDEVSASLSGEGLAASRLTVSPASFPFGDVDVGQASVAQAFTFTNADICATGTPSVRMFGGDSQQFQIADGGDGCTSPLDAGASCAVSVTFNPRDAGASASAVQFVASPGGTVSATVSGTGAP